MENKHQYYHFEYVDENEFRKKERSVRKYNMLAYKKLVFDHYPSLREGKFVGDLVATSKENNTKSYEIELPTDSLSAKVHGKLKLHYTVYEDSRVVLLSNITPEDILDEGHRSELATYKGVIISKSNAEKDMFKVNLLNALNINKEE